MPSFSRSAASRYCTRSLVPRLKKSTSRASAGAISAAAGTSIIAPSGVFGLNALPSAASSRSTSRMTARVARTSSMPPTIGIRIWTGCCALMRRNARSCGLQDLGVLEQQPDPALRQQRVVRRRQREIGQVLVAADVEQAERELARVKALGGAVQELELLVLRREVAADREAELGAVEADAAGVVEQRGLGVGELAHVGEQGRSPCRRA